MYDWFPALKNPLSRSPDRETIFHWRRGRVSFRCPINKSAVVWQNEERVPVKWLIFLSGPFRSTRDLIYLCQIFAIWRENQKSEIKVFKILQATIMNSSMEEVKEKEIAFLQRNFCNVRFSENYCFPQIFFCEFDLVHSNINNIYRGRIVIHWLLSCMR